MTFGEFLIKPHFLAYFDILGYTDGIEENENTFFDKNIFGMLCFKLGMDTLFKHSNKAHEDNQNIIRYKTFSDNCLLYVPISDNKRTNNMNIMLLVDACLNMQCHFCKQGLKLRGAVTKGNLFAGSDFVFGSGLIKAVGLEKQATYPIIMLDKDIDIPETICDEFPVNTTTDNKKFLDYLEYFLNRCESCDDMENMKGFLKKHCKLIESIPHINDALRLKREFLIWYHNQFCKTHEFDNFIFEQK